jgi:uncharacterized Zn-finger protein
LALAHHQKIHLATESSKGDQAVGSNGKEKIYSCSQCEKTFASSAGLLFHTRTHTNEKPYCCSDCGKLFTQPTTLAQHKITHLDKSYSCPFCDRSFATAAYLESHVKSQHTNEKPFMCSDCGKSFARATTLNTHKKIHGEKMYSCSHCTRSFSKPHTLREHIKTHTKEKPYSCPECGKSFAQSSTYRGHLKTHFGANIPDKYKKLSAVRSSVPEKEVETEVKSTTGTFFQQDFGRSIPVPDKVKTLPVLSTLSEEDEENDPGLSAFCPQDFYNSR